MVYAFSMMIFCFTSMEQKEHTPSEPANQLGSNTIKWMRMFEFSNKEMPTKLKDTLEKVKELDNKSNSSNSELLIECYEYLRSVQTSET
jgi:hypothetical protein